MSDHPKSCWCAPCATKKTVAFRTQYIEKVRLMVQVRPPRTKDALVPVRAHFRRQPNYLRKHPALRAVALKLSEPFRFGDES